MTGPITPTGQALAAALNGWGDDGGDGDDAFAPARIPCVNLFDVRQEFCDVQEVPYAWVWCWLGVLIDWVWCRGAAAVPAFGLDWIKLNYAHTHACTHTTTGDRPAGVGDLCAGPRGDATQLHRALVRMDGWMDGCSDSRRQMFRLTRRNPNPHVGTACFTASGRWGPSA